jgi:uncharacterized membrane protein YbaN (DUF454 family)
VNGVLRHVLGWLSLLVGLAGLVLPILQGWFFIALGALLLAPDMPVFARLLAWIERRFPGLRGSLRRWRKKLGNPRPGS